MQPDDAYWRRPAGLPPGVQPPAPTLRPTEHRPPAGYAGPPPSVPPPTGWRVPHVVQLPPPRHLPVQDHDRMDLEEARAKTLTLGFGMVALAVIVVLVAILCGRALF